MNNKIILGFSALLLCSIFSCNHSGKNGSTPDTAAASAYDTVLLNNYRIYLHSLDTLQPASNTTAAKKYADLFKSANQNTRDSAFSVFKDFYNKLDQTLDNSRDASISYDSLIRDSNGQLPKLSAKLATFGQALKDNGFKVYLSGGDPYIGQDLDFEAEWFYAYISAPLKDFLIELNKEDKEGFSEDAGLIISPQQLADRTVWWENFSKKYANTIIGRPSLENWRSYLGTMMNGMDNSPVLQSGQTLNPYYKAAYSRIIANYPTSQSAKYINPYFKLLQNKQNDKAKDLVRDYGLKKIIY